MDIPKNEFKRALAKSRAQIGVFVGLDSPIATEVLATAGFDFLLVDGEHGPGDVRSILAQLQAAAAYPVSVVVRPANHDASLIKRLLGIGVQTLLVPMVETAEQAAALVAATRYPPAGIRGVGTGLERGARWNAIDGYHLKADAEMCLVVQVESMAGLANLDAIAATPGVDGVFIGPADLAASMGHLGQTGHPEVRAAISDAIARIGAAGKAPGVFAHDPALGAQYREGGAVFLAVGADTGLLRNAAVKLAASFKDTGGAAGATY
ncbi:MAG: HpcH/HpaI aldolase/citrate lyase family protein [Rhodocyclaceae bacterium]|nr:HpcH/HpaI aldolase/citrate lyase family protein [Rhodocyclaceae bacterium]